MTSFSSAVNTGIQGAIQTGILEHKFREGLRSVMAYAMFAEEEPVASRIGETVTKTRKGEKAAVNTYLDPASSAPSNNSGLDNGLTPSSFSIEQFTVTLRQKADAAEVNQVGDKFSVASEALKIAGVHGRQAQRSREAMARAALYDAYMGGNTVVISGVSPTTTGCRVDDIRGFQKLLNAKGQLVGVSSTDKLSVAETGTTTQTLHITGVTADVSNASSAAAVGGISGTIVFDTATAPTVGDYLTASNAPQMLRPNGKAHAKDLDAGDLIDTPLILAATTLLRDNGIPELDLEEGSFYACILSNTSMQQLFSDPTFQNAYATRYNSKEIVTGRVFTYMGVAFVPTTEAIVQAAGSLVTVKVHRPIVLGKECLIRADFQGFEEWATQDNHGALSVSFTDGIAQVIRPPMDRLGQLVSFAWQFITDFTCPSDMTTTSATIPTASNAMFKRAIVLEHAA